MFTICSLYVHHMFTINELHILIQCDTCKIYEKLAPLSQERSHCISSLYVHYMFTISFEKVSILIQESIESKCISLSYTQCDTCKIYKKLAPLTQERSYCIRNRIFLFTICSLYVHYMFTICSVKVSLYKKLYISIHYMFTVCSLYVHYMFTICSLYVHCIFTVCSLYVRYTFTNAGKVSLYRKLVLNSFLKVVS